MLKSLSEMEKKQHISVVSKSLLQVISSQERNVNFTKKKPGKETLRKQTRSTSPEIRSIGIVFP